jgi:hypothetical protein
MTKEAKSGGWQPIGVVDVDSGHLILTDYPDQREVRDAYDLIVRKDDMPLYLQLNYDRGHPGAGVIVSTGLGDGAYPVYAKITNTKYGKRLTEIRVVFIPHPVLK